MQVAELQVELAQLRDVLVERYLQVANNLEGTQRTKAYIISLTDMLLPSCSVGM